MGFDHKQDALQKEETNRRILDAGFSMFSKMSIVLISNRHIISYEIAPHMSSNSNNKLRLCSIISVQSCNSYTSFICNIFHKNYVKGKNDKTLCTEVSENSMFLSIMHLMLAAITRYAVGLAYEKDIESDNELVLLKNMLMHEFSRKK